MNFFERVGIISQQKVGEFVISREKPLGTGAFGVVALGYKQSNADEVVAIKTIKRQKYDKLILKELQILQLLKNHESPNILSLVYSESDKENFFLVTEFCNAGTATRLFRVKKRISDEEAKIFIRQMASAMRFLDKEEIAHRDIKPDNILVHANNPNSVDFNELTFKLADFGLATKIPKGKSANSKCGSVFYMAPEIFQKHRSYDRKVDLWSIGVILYQGMIGGLPFKVRNMRSPEDMEKLMSSPIKVVLPSWLSSDAKDLTFNLLEWCPAKRIDFGQFFEHPFLNKTKSSPSPPTLNLSGFHFSPSLESFGNSPFSSPDEKDNLLLNGMLAPTTVNDVSNDLGSFVLIDAEAASLEKVNEKAIIPQIEETDGMCIVM